MPLPMAVADVAAAAVRAAVAVGDVAGVLDFAGPHRNMLKHW